METTLHARTFVTIVYFPNYLLGNENCLTIAAGTDWRSAPHSERAAVSIIENSYSKYFENCFITDRRAMRRIALYVSSDSASQLFPGYVNRHMIFIPFYTRMGMNSFATTL